MIEVELAGARVEPRQAVVHPASQPGQDLPAHRVPRDVVGVVLHRRRHHVVAVAELGEHRVHDRVERLGGVPVQCDARPPRRADELGDRVVAALEERGHPLRRGGLPAVHVLVPRPERQAELEQFARRLGAGRVVGHDPAVRREGEVLSDGADVEPAPVASCHRIPPYPLPPTVRSRSRPAHRANHWVLTGRPGRRAPRRAGFWNGRRACGRSAAGGTRPSWATGTGRWRYRGWTRRAGRPRPPAVPAR